MTIEEEQAALRLQMIADAETDLTKDLDPRDPDADYMKRLAKEMAAGVVDAVLDRHERRQACGPLPACAMTPAVYAAAIKERLAELYAGVPVMHDVESTFDPATKRIETVVTQRMTSIVRQVGGK